MLQLVEHTSGETGETRKPREWKRNFLERMSKKRSDGTSYHLETARIEDTANGIHGIHKTSHNIPRAIPWRVQ